MTPRLDGGPIRLNTSVDKFVSAGICSGLSTTGDKKVKKLWPIAKRVLPPVVDRLAFVLAGGLLAELGVQPGVVAEALGTLLSVL